jgi:dTMP kinase
MFADRAQSLHQVILPALSRGEIVLCDRYTDSSEAYQGAGRSLGVERVLAMHRAACDNIQPDLTLLLLPPLESSLKRARRRNDRTLRQDGSDENRFEREGDDFYRRVYDQYRIIAAREPQRVALLDQPGSIDEIATQILTVVRDRLAAPGALADSSKLTAQS